MALSPEEMNKRRKKRAQAQKKQRQEQKRLRLALIAVAVVLALSGFGIYRIAQNAPAQQVQVEAPVEEETEAPTTEETVPSKRNPITTFHIRAAGDLNITTSVVDAGLAAGGYDFTRAFQDVASVLSDADVTVMNLEGNICGEPYGSASTSAPDKILNSLRNAGVDLVQMANSASINNGLIGLNSTLGALRLAGLEPLGAYGSPKEFQNTKGYTICDVKGVKVAFVAFTKGMGGMGMPSGNEDCVNLLYVDYDDTYKKVDTAGISQILDDVAAEKPDLIVAMLHWGSENNDTISSTQKSIQELMMKKGVDIIIGTHPHLVQEISFDPMAGTLIAYSLGDFFGDASRGGTNYSIILDIEVTKDADLGTTRVTGFSYTPIYTVTEAQSADGFRRVVRIEQAIQAYEGNFVDKVKEDAYKDMIYSLERIQSRTSGRG